MASIAPTAQATSSTTRLPLRRRSDVVATRQLHEGREFWVLKDPLALRYYRLQPEEYALWQMLDGQTTLAQLKAQFELKFRPRRIRLAELNQFLGMLHGSGLLLSDAANQAQSLLRRSENRKRQARRAKWANPLAIRLGSFQPSRVLDVAEPLMRWLFSPLAVVGSLVLMALAGLSLVIHFEEFAARLPRFHDFFTPSNLPWFALVLVGTKCWHELGHAVACRRYGGEVSELGVLLLVFAPCLYCDVTDSWLLPSKWRRIAIAAAGMYVELTLAAICTLLWWQSVPGLFNQLCLTVMMISGLSTVLFNANPLVRYDGYYIVSDLVEVPNLSQKARSLLHRRLGTWLLGVRPPADPLSPRTRTGFLMAYAIAAAIYRWMIVLAIVLALSTWLRPYRLEMVARLLGTAALFGLVVQPLWSLIRFFRIPGRTQLVNRTRLALSTVAVGGVGAMLIWLPVTHRVYGTVQLEPRMASQVFVETPGRLDATYVRAGERVAAGEPLARLVNPQLTMSLLQLEGRRDQLVTQLEGLRRRRFQDQAASLSVRQLEESLAAVEEQIAKRHSDLQRLTIVAPVAGVVLPPPNREPQQRRDVELVAWNGTPLDGENLGCRLDAGTLLCRLGEPQRVLASLVIEDVDIRHVALGQEVEIELTALPHQTFRGTVSEVAKSDLQITPRQLSSRTGGDLATYVDEAGVERPLVTSYQVRVETLDDPQGLLRAGLRGQARVTVAPQPLGQRVWHWFCRTFRFV